MSLEGRHFAKHDLGRCSSIRAESLGQPGSRHFRLYADTKGGSALLWVEKEQLQELAIAIKQLMQTDLRELEGSQPGGQEGVSADYDFKVSRLTLGKAEEGGTYLLLADMTSGEEDDKDPGDFPDVALHIEGEQLDRLADEALVVCASGRPRCPLCGAALNEGETHVCPRANGHVHA